MIIGGGVDMPFIGFEIPLMLATFPLAIITALYFRVRYVRAINVDEVLAKLPPPVYSKHGLMLFAPIVLLVGLMIAIRIIPQYVPDIGMPLIFVLGALTGIGSGDRWEARKISSAAIRGALPVMAILVGVGAFVQIMTLTGVRGMIAVSALQLPESLLYVGIALMMPAFGSAYAASSVLGVPLVYLFLGRNEIIVTSALSLIAGVGDQRNSSPRDPVDRLGDCDDHLCAGYRGNH
jgi:TRAP-type C4-dicarboxylate transport system permease large subunit